MGPLEQRLRGSDEALVGGTLKLDTLDAGGIGRPQSRPLFTKIDAEELQIHG